MIDLQPLRLTFDRFALDADEARLTMDGRPVAMPPRLFDLLCALARKPGQLVEKGALLDAVWGHRFVSDSTLKTTISDLRTVLGDNAREPRFVETVARRGYRFIAALQPDASANVSAGPPDATRRPALASKRAAFIGRRVQLDRLSTAWTDTVLGQRRVMWITGEPGIGKTMLIDRFVSDTKAAVVARGQCIEQSGGGEPYLPVLAALASLCNDDPELPALIRSIAPTWFLQLPWLGSESTFSELRHALAGTTQARMIREFGELLDRYTAERPLVLVTEDLHWSDQGTLSLINHVARQRGRARLLWLASFRLAEIIADGHPLNALRHELRLHRLADEILLDPFSETEVAEYVAERLVGRPNPEAVAQIVHARTDGLPLFVANLVSTMRAEWPDGQDADIDAACIAAMEVPESLVGVIELQFARLQPEQRAVLCVASVCGVTFRARQVADAMDQTLRWVDDRCEALIRGRQWLDVVEIAGRPGSSPESRYSFRHALYRQVIYATSGAATRARLHGLIAASLLGSRSDDIAITSSEIASHFELSRDIATSLRHYVDAAATALGCFAPLEVIALTDHALTLLPQCADSLDSEVALLEANCVAVAQVHGLTSPQARTAFRRLSELSDQWPERVSNHLDVGYGWVLSGCGEYEAALEQARLKIASASRDRYPVRYAAACNLYGKTLGHLGRLDEGCEWLERGLEAIRNAGDITHSIFTVVDLEVLLRCHLGQLQAHRGEGDAAREQLAEAGRRTDRIGHPYTRFRFLYFDSLVESRLQATDRVLANVADMHRIADDYAIGRADGQGLALEGWARARLGDAQRGHALIMRGFELEMRRGCYLGATGILGAAVEALILAGSWDEAQSRLDQALALAERIDERLHLPDLERFGQRIAAEHRCVGRKR